MRKKFHFEQKPELMKDEDYETLVESFVTSRGKDGFTEDELLAFIRECENHLIGHAMVELALKGLVNLDFRDPKNGLMATPTKLGHDVQEKLDERE